MLKQEEVAFLKALTSIELSPVFLRERKKAMAAGKKRKALAASKATSTAALERPGGEARTSRDTLSKRKAEELSSSDCPSESASRRPAPGHLFDDGPEAQGTTGELAALGSRQLGPTEGGLAYATVVAGVASPQQPSGPHKSIAKGADHSTPAASSEAVTRRMSLGDMSGPLCGMPDGAITNAQMSSNSAAPAAERHNKTPIFVSGVADTRGILIWIRASCPSGLSAQLKGEKLVLVPRTADGFRAAVSALRSLDGSKGVSFHTFSVPEDRCVRLLVKNLGWHMPGDVVREELENLDICVRGILQLRSARRDQEDAKARPLTPHFIVSVTRGPEVAKVRSLTELSGLRVTVETYVAPKGPLQCKRCQRFGHTQRYCGYAPRCVACGEAHPSGECSTPQQELKCCSCGGNHTANYRGCTKWKEAKAALAKRAPTERSRVGGAPSPPNAKQAMPSAQQENLGPGWNHVIRGAESLRLQLCPLPNPPLAQS
jgi:hypothetical protein